MSFVMPSFGLECISFKMSKRLKLTVKSEEKSIGDKKSSCEIRYSCIEKSSWGNRGD